MAKRPPAAAELAETARVAFGKDLLAARTAIGMTQKEVGLAAGKAETYVSEVEKGKKNITIGTMVALADAVGLKVNLQTIQLRKPRKRRASR
jgi:transcriptional regulator with XRE-family HTH domain